jgi:FkbM family methyltransferase
MLRLGVNFCGYVINNNIKCDNDGDICQLFICKELIEKKSTFFKDTIFVDIGAHIGAWALMISILTNNKSEIYCYEPSKIYFNSLKTNCNTSNIKLFNYGIGEEGQVSLIRTAGGGYIQKNGENTENKDTEIIEIKRLILDKQIYIMKIDVDGYEHKLLQTIYEHLHLIHSLICEFTIYEYSTNREECIKTSCEILTKMFVAYPFVYGLSRNRAPYCVFIKKSDILDWSEEHYDNKVSTDLLFTHHEIKTVTTVNYVKGQWYA